GFLSFRHGMESLVQALKAPLAKVVLGQGARHLARRDGGWRVTLTNGGTLEATNVILACPPWIAARLLEDEHPTLAAALGDFASGTLTVVNLLMRQEDVAPPTGSGFVRAGDLADTELRACTFSSHKFPYRTPDNRFLARCFFAGTAGDISDQQLAESALGTLRDLAGFGSGRPLRIRSRRLQNRLVRFDVGHQDRVRRAMEHSASVGGLFLAGNAYGGVGILDAMESGAAAARALSMHPESRT
ncbi:MAG: FAD-dependent oxidoreductase, partial [Myxococcales bacterium]|nr:FAD-dependent oxidoreductase [Myxococcales bacterium]